MKCFRFLLSCILLQQSFGRLLQRGPGDSVDLHNEEFCTDISQYSDKYYVDEAERCCTTTYEPNCVRKQKKVCIDVTETKCEAYSNQNCKTVNERKPGGSKASLGPADADIKNCVARDVVVTHVKKVPHCEDKKSLNCETGWKVVNGEKVWSGEEECEEVTWQDCKLVDKEVPFNAVESDCSGPAEKEQYMTCSNKTVDVEVMVSKCEFDEGAKCGPVTREECVYVDYEDCSQVVKKDNCEEVPVRRPTQDFTHKKKCLLPQDIERLTGGSGDF